MIKKIIPSKLKNKLKRHITKCRMWLAYYQHKKRLRQIAKKDKIKIAFLLVNESIWKYERLYFLLKNNRRFYPVVFICPFLTYGEDLMVKEMNNIYTKFKNRNYNVVKTLNKDGTYLDVKKDFKPDIVFFSTPWGHSKEMYRSRNFMNVLTCYVHYGFNVVKNHYFNMETVLFSWKTFVETDYHKESAKIEGLNNGHNFVVTGYAGIDSLIDKEYKSKQVWKRQNNEKKKVIWAPHHSIQGVKGRNVFHSNFLNYSNLMLDIAKTYENDIQFSFKPHPNLKGKLNEVWGVEKTNKYYKTWENLPNGQLNEGDYIDLFLESDAMIHDSSSFLIEYLYTNKSVLFLMDDLNLELLNDIGVKALSIVQKAYNEKGIFEFIDSVVLKRRDSFKFKREVFVRDYLTPPNNNLASANIYNYLNKKFN